MWPTNLEQYMALIQALQGQAYTQFQNQLNLVSQQLLVVQNQNQQMMQQFNVAQQHSQQALQLSTTHIITHTLRELNSILPHILNTEAVVLQLGRMPMEPSPPNQDVAAPNLPNQNSVEPSPPVALEEEPSPPVAIEEEPSPPANETEFEPISDMEIERRSGPTFCEQDEILGRNGACGFYSDNRFANGDWKEPNISKELRKSRKRAQDACLDMIGMKRSAFEADDIDEDED